MPLDIDDGYKKIKKEVTTKQKYNQVKKDIKQLEKKAGDSFEDWGGGLESKFGKFANKQLSSAEKAKEKFQKDFKTQFDQMLEIKFLTQKSGDKKTTKYLKKTFVTAIEQIKPQIFDIVSELGVKAVGCESEQEFPANATFYIKVGAIDFMGLLKEDPNETIGKISYEQNPIVYNTAPFSMNKELYSRIQNINVPYSAPTFAGVNDETKEIDVSGIAKVSQTDVVDDAFFEFNEVDLRYIDSVVSDIKLGVVEFEDCGTVKLPVDVNAVLDTLDSLKFNPGTNNNNEINNAAESITKPFERRGLNLDLSFLKEYPRALLMTILSPKTILPIMIMAKSLGQSTVDSVNSLMEFAKQFKSYIVQLASKVMALFVKILFDIIKADIIALTKSILADIKNESVVKKSLLVLSLVALITKLVTDFRQCKSVIDDLLSILSLVEKSMKAQKKPLPYPLLVASRVLTGFSKTRAMLNVIQRFESLGLPTGPMPDGSPNLFLAAADAIIGAIDEEETKNGQVQIAVDPLSVLPIGTTIPQVVYGKKL